MLPWEKRTDVSGTAAHTHSDSAMLDCVIRIKQFDSTRPDIITLGKHQHLFDPFRRNDLDIVIQE